MKKALITALCLLASPAIAANLTPLPPLPKLPPLPIPAVQDIWTGLHFGAFGGYNWMDNPKAKVLGDFGQDVRLNSDSFLLGASAGYDLHFANFIIGGGSDFSWNIADVNNVTFATSNVTAGNALAQVHSNFQKLSTMRGRFGYLLTPALLVYGTGGMALGEPGIGVGLLSSSFSPVSMAKYGGWRAGFAIGGGVEWNFAPNLSANVEFLHFDLGKPTAVFTAISPTGTLGIVQASYPAQFNRVTLGLNYKFNIAPVGGSFLGL